MGARCSWDEATDLSSPSHSPARTTTGSAVAERATDRVESAVDDDVTSVWIVSADGTGERGARRRPARGASALVTDGHRIAYQVQTSERIPDGGAGTHDVRVVARPPRWRPAGAG